MKKLFSRDGISPVENLSAWWYENMKIENLLLLAYLAIKITCQKLASLRDTMGNDSSATLDQGCYDRDPGLAVNPLQRLVSLDYECRKITHQLKALAFSIVIIVAAQACPTCIQIGEHIQCSGKKERKKQELVPWALKLNIFVFPFNFFSGINVWMLMKVFSFLYNSCF